MVACVCIEMSIHTLMFTNHFSFPLIIKSLWKPPQIPNTQDLYQWWKCHNPMLSCYKSLLSTHWGWMISENVFIGLENSLLHMSPSSCCKPIVNCSQLNSQRLTGIAWLCALSLLAHSNSKRHIKIIHFIFFTICRMAHKIGAIWGKGTKTPDSRAIPGLDSLKFESKYIHFNSGRWNFNSGRWI